MKRYKDEVIKEAVKNIFGGDVDITEYDTYYVVKVEQMYNYVNCSLDNLLKLSDFFDTKNINIDDYFFNGCETCDHGSSYTKEFYVKEEV